MTAPRGPVHIPGLGLRVSPAAGPWEGALGLSWAKFPKRKKLPQASGLEVPPRPFSPGGRVRPRGLTLVLGLPRDQDVL